LGWQGAYAFRKFWKGAMPNPDPKHGETKMSINTLILKIHPAALFCLAALDMLSVKILMSSNTQLTEKLVLFALCVLLHFLVCGFEYWKIKTWEEVTG